MGDHFVLLVDRLLTESTLEAAIENRKVSQNGCASASASASAVEVGAEFSLQKSNFSDVSLLPRKLVECRICHDEDEDSNMETPCSCCGSLKYAHRKCVQRWCNEKGDIICEICRQVISHFIYDAMLIKWRDIGLLAFILVSAIQAWLYSTASTATLWGCSNEFQGKLGDYQKRPT
eukprot:TRINITY_DN9895_c1_g2_i1.p1 TRINITY_DN9895_c1_g2~~TRINITY_DN9895_c1_g2_i1.p1  ORF type:complete len:176 (+),score=26.11 TRINITY_DN9895_c1_g2_i1:1525-2052(+)